MTPSYQQAEFLEETIRSVLLQGYPTLEYLVIDGGSTDGSVELIERYDPWLTFWRTGPDGGQVEAINEGFSRATGHWRSWLNSDDFYAPGALLRIGEEPQSESWIVGETGYVNDASRHVGRFPTAYRKTSLVSDETLAWVDVLCGGMSGTALAQQSAFWTAAAHDVVGALDESLEYVFEHEFWARLAYAGFSPKLLELELALYRVHEHQKTTGATSAAADLEVVRVLERWLTHCPSEQRRHLLAYRQACIRRAWITRGKRFAARLAPAALRGRKRRRVYLDRNE